MPVIRKSFLPAMSNSNPGPNGEAPHTWNPNAVLAEELCKLTGVSDLKELIRSGRAVRLNGEPFLKEGEELPDDDRKTFSEPESELLEAIQHGGVMVFDDLETANPRPRCISGNDAEGFTLTDPLEEGDVEHLLQEAAEKHPLPPAPEKPLFLNVWWDKLLQAFGSRGTDSMCRYRREQEKYEDAKKEKEGIRSGGKAIRDKGIAAARVYAKENRSEKSLRQLTLEGSEIKARYERMNIEPGTAGNEVKELLSFATVGLGAIYGDLFGARISNRPKMEKNLAGLVALDLILRERVGSGNPREGGRIVAGPLETKLNEVGTLKFVESLTENPVFRKSVAALNHKGLDEFVSSGGARKVSAQILQELTQPEHVPGWQPAQNVEEKLYENPVNLK